VKTTRRDAKVDLGGRVGQLSPSHPRRLGGRARALHTLEEVQLVLMEQGHAADRDENVARLEAEPSAEGVGSDGDDLDSGRRLSRARGGDPRPDRRGSDGGADETPVST